MAREITDDEIQALLEKIEAQALADRPFSETMEAIAKAVGLLDE